MTVRVLTGDVFDHLDELPDESVHCVVTSPPYFALRDYGVEGAIGLEPTFDEHLEVMVRVFREVGRVLRKDGTLWLNYGDAYAGLTNGRSAADTKALGKDDRTFRDKPFSTVGGVFKAKDLMMMPARVALALQADGWWLRSEIVWHKPNPMPESAKDRPTSAHEKIYLLTRNARYFYDADAVRIPFNGANLRNVWTAATEPFRGAHFAVMPTAIVEPCIKAGTGERGCCPECGAPVIRIIRRIDQGWDGSKYGERVVAASGGAINGGTAKSTLGSSNGKLVGQSETAGWEPTCECGVGGPIPCIVLDPFAGAGTVGLVADRLGRDAILIELNPEYADMARARISGDAGMFAEVAAG